MVLQGKDGFDDMHGEKHLNHIFNHPELEASGSTQSGGRTEYVDAVGGTPDHFASQRSASCTPDPSITGRARKKTV